MSNLSAHPLLTAGAIEEITASLLSEYNGRYVVICEMFTRKTSGIPADLYESRWRQAMNYLSTLGESNRNIRIMETPQKIRRTRAYIRPRRNTFK